MGNNIEYETLPKGAWEEHPIMTNHFVVATFDSKYGLPNDFCAWYMKKELGSEKAVIDKIKENVMEDIDFTFADLMNNSDKANVDLTEDDLFDNFDSEYMYEYTLYLNEKNETDKFYYEFVNLKNDDGYFIICFKKKGDKYGN